MTTIAIKRGPEPKIIVAADRQITEDCSKKEGKKIYRPFASVICAGAGSYDKLKLFNLYIKLKFDVLKSWEEDSILEFVHDFKVWLKTEDYGKFYEKEGEQYVLILDAKIFDIRLAEDFLAVHKINNDIFALGSGKAYAIIAMECGKSPTEAVEMAINHDLYSGFGVDVVTNLDTFYDA